MASQPAYDYHSQLTASLATPFLRAKTLPEEGKLLETWVWATERGLLPVLNGQRSNIADLPGSSSSKGYEKMPWNALHHAAFDGRAEVAAALISSASMDINEPNENGFTPLIMAAQEGHHRVVRALINNGACLDSASHGKATALMLASQNGCIVVAKLLVDAGAHLELRNQTGCSALHLAAAEGHLCVVKVLVSAGANLEAWNNDRNTPLHLAVRPGHFAVVEALSAAGAESSKVNSFRQTPLFTASRNGHVDIVKLLVDLRLSPACGNVRQDQRSTNAALECAIDQGHAEIVREVLRLGIGACGGASRGGGALCRAAKKENIGMMSMLRDAGVVDKGLALSVAINGGREKSVLFLLRQEWAAPGSSYLERDASDERRQPSPFRMTPLCHAVGYAFPRIVRLLLDAGADETATARVTFVAGMALDETPLEMTNRYLGGKIIQEEPATESQLLRLEAIRRLLLRVEATRAVSWLWPSSSRVDQAAEQSGNRDIIRSKSKARKVVVRIVRHGEGVRRAVLSILLR